MENSEKLNKSYDHVLIGYNLASISFAALLAKENKNFCLVDSKHFGSNPFKKISSLDQYIYTRVPFTGMNDHTFSTEEENFLGQSSTQESTPITFEKGDFKSFLGFGDVKVDAMDAVMTFCQTQHLECELTPEKFWSDHLESIQNKIFLDQQVTDLQFEGDQVTSLTLNGKTQLKGNHFYFFDQFPFLFDKIGQQTKKIASQFAKAKWFSSVSLIIHHKEEPETYELNQVYLLKGSKEQPCIGQFTRMNDQLISRWESFFPAELTPDSETTGVCLKEIKKQVKRAFSTPDISVNPEHILIQNQIFAEMGKSGIVSGKLGNFSNLEVHSPLFNQGYGWAHEMIAGLRAYSSQKNEEQPRIEVAAPQATC